MLQGDFVIHVASLDIIVDKINGNIADPTVQQFWFRGIAQGWIVGLLAGPPCETWSRARAVQYFDVSRRTPRVVRTGEDLWGLVQLSLSELEQVCRGNLLLCFTLEAFVRLAEHRGFAVVEHPLEPDEPELASIWRLPIVLALRALP